jgi:hypothetical protein
MIPLPDFFSFSGGLLFESFEHDIVVFAQVLRLQLAGNQGCISV